MRHCLRRFGSPRTQKKMDSQHKKGNGPLPNLRRRLLPIHQNAQRNTLHHPSSPFSHTCYLQILPSIPPFFKQARKYTFLNRNVRLRTIKGQYYCHTDVSVNSACTHCLEFNLSCPRFSFRIIRFLFPCVRVIASFKRKKDVSFLTMGFLSS